MAAYTISQPLQKVVLALCEDTNSPRSLAVSMLLKAGELDQLFNLKIDPTSYFDFHSLLDYCGFASRGFFLRRDDARRDWNRYYSNVYFQDAQCTELLRKLWVDDTSRKKQRKDAALRNFRSAEYECYKTNVRFDKFVNNGPYGPGDERFFPLLDEMKRFVTRILGPLPRDLNGRFGPGSTFDDRGALCTIPDKMTSRPTVTSQATLLDPLWARTAWSRALSSDNPLISGPRIVRGNRFTTVPKDALKDRGICIEPGLNVFYQLSVGAHLKRRLKMFGLDLGIGQSKHQSLACEASRTGSHATIDLSNASDTVSYNVVKLLLPEEWFLLLDSLRSPLTNVDGKWHHLQKFSSMGNGFTFELETLVFLSICQALAHLRGTEYLMGTDILVYGDDIIVPTDLADDVISGLKWFGFTPNPRKTFLGGPFRESCGGDFYNGTAVRPHYLKEDPHEPQHWISLANGIRRVGYSDPRTDYRFDHLRRAWLRCLDALPSYIRRLRGPTHLGDLVIHDSSFRRRWRSSGIGYIAVYRPVVRPLDWAHWKPNVVLASALYGVPDKGPTPRTREGQFGDFGVTGYKVGWVAFS